MSSSDVDGQELQQLLDHLDVKAEPKSQHGPVHVTNLPRGPHGSRMAIPEAPTNHQDDACALFGSIRRD